MVHAIDEIFDEDKTEDVQLFYATNALTASIFGDQCYPQQIWLLVYVSVVKSVEYTT